jgi:hypothetical protein
MMRLSFAGAHAAVFRWDFWMERPSTSKPKTYLFYLGDSFYPRVVGGRDGLTLRERTHYAKFIDCLRYEGYDSARRNRSRDNSDQSVALGFLIP